MELELPDIRHCPDCGGLLRVTPREGRERPVCPDCGRVVYVNPYPAACLVLIREGSVLLVRRSIEPHFGEWCLPGGFIEWGESPDGAACRELREETGISADALTLVGAYGSVSGPKRHVLLLAYRVDRWEGEPVPGDDASEAEWFRLGEMPKLAFRVHERAIHDVMEVTRGDAHTFD
jgi:8-oxo-dGTP diphosphatase